jgi:hypothetical protein
MRRFLLIAVLMLWGSSVIAATQPPSEVRGSIQRSLAFLEKEGTAWKAERACASCHHAPMMVWALGEARTRGYAVNEKALADLLAWVAAPDDRAKVLPAPRSPQAPRIVSFGPLTLSLGLGAVPHQDEGERERLKRLLDLLVTDQEEAGSWSQSKGGRPPMIGDAEVMTLWTLLALTPPGWEGPVPDSWKASRERGLAWLAANPAGDDFRVLGLRMLLQQRLGGLDTAVKPLVKQLLARQNSDGGWGQTPELDSDAYATGLTLYALSGAGVRHDGPALQRARAFLLKTQREDGSWPMVPRVAGPNVPPSKDARPIAYVGTAWAALGLMRSSPAPKDAPPQRGSR